MLSSPSCALGSPETRDLACHFRELRSLRAAKCMRACSKKSESTNTTPLFHLPLPPSQIFSRAPFEELHINAVPRSFRGIRHTIPTRACGCYLLQVSPLPCPGGCSQYLLPSRLCVVTGAFLSPSRCPMVSSSRFNGVTHSHC